MIKVSDEGTKVFEESGSFAEKYLLQRQRLDDFSFYFKRKLGFCINRIESLMGYLKFIKYDIEEKEFFAALKMVREDLIKISLKFSDMQVYDLANEYVNYIDSKYRLIRYLNKDIKNYTSDKKPLKTESENLKNPEIFDLEELKTLATNLKNFMESYPLVSDKIDFNQERVDSGYIDNALLEATKA